MKLSFRQLEAFHAIYESGTATDAAKKLGISQPGISNLLAQLEAGQGLRLFERKQGRLIPTAEAEILFDEVDTLMRGLARTSQTVQYLQDNQLGQLQVASQHSISFRFMPQLVSRFIKNRPNLSVSFQSQYSPKVQEWVAAGLFEIGVSEAPLYHDNLNVIPIKIGTALAVPADSPYAAYDVLTPELLAKAPFIVMSSDHPTHRSLQNAFDEAGVTLRPRVYSHLFKNLLSFVEEGVGVALVDAFALEGHSSDRIVAKHFEPRIAMDLMVVTSKNRPLSNLGQEFLDVLLKELKFYEPQSMA